MVKHMRILYLFAALLLLSSPALAQSLSLEAMLGAQEAGFYEESVLDVSEKS